MKRQTQLRMLYVVVVVVALVIGALIRDTWGPFWRIYLG